MTISASRWIALLLLAALLSATVAGQTHSVLWWAILAPILFVLALIPLRDQLPEFDLAAPAVPSRRALCPRAPPLS